MNTFIDPSLFLGMHSANDHIRIAAKNFFVEHFQDELFMTFEDVGFCDDVIWHFSRDIQDAYYPFMDRLHTEMRIHRIPYSEQTLHKAQDIAGSLTTTEKLLLATVHEQNAVVYSLNTRLQTAGGNFVYIIKPSNSGERSFPQDLEAWYQQSLSLRLK